MYSLSSTKMPPGQTTKPTTAVTTIATPTVRTTNPITETGQTPFNGPHAIPGRIQAEDYDNGGADIAYYDTTAGNTGGSYRLNDAVDVRAISGITDIAYIDENEWTEYTVTVATGGAYTANFRVGSPRAGHTVAVTVDGAAGCTVTVPNTGSYSVYATASAPLNLAAGTHVIRLTYHNNLDGYGQSIDSFETRQRVRPRRYRLRRYRPRSFPRRPCRPRLFRPRLYRPRRTDTVTTPPQRARRSARH